MKRYKSIFKESVSLKDAQKILKGEIVEVSQFLNDPDLDVIFKKGKFFDASSMIKVSGNEGRCHWNVASLFKEKKISNIVIGYAENWEGWHQHTWGLLNGKIVETTPSNFINTNYFGYVLSPKEAKAFSEFSEIAIPGQGFMRTKKGGSIKDHLK